MGLNLWFVRYVSQGKLNPSREFLCLGSALSPSGFPTFWYIMTTVMWLDLEESPSQLQVTANKTTLRGMSLSHFERFSVSYQSQWHFLQKQCLSGFCSNFACLCRDELEIVLVRVEVTFPSLQNSRVVCRLWNCSDNSCCVALCISVLI